MNNHVFYTCISLVLYNFYGVVYLILLDIVRILFFRYEGGSDGIKRETVIILKGSS